MIVKDFTIVNYSKNNYYFGGDLRCKFIYENECTDEELKNNYDICKHRETNNKYKNEKSQKRFYSDYKNS